MSEDSSTRPTLSKPLLITLISVGGALLIAIIVLLIVLLTGGSGEATETLPSPSASESTPSPSPTPSASDETSPTPTPAPSETEAAPPPPPPPSNDPKIDSFKASTSTYVCSADDIAFVTTSEITLSWKTTNADQVFLGVGTNDASQEPYLTDQPGDGNATLNISCPGNQTNKYTLTVIGNGHKVSKSVNVVVK
jgi:hypothetical protein